MPDGGARFPERGKPQEGSTRAAHLPEHHHVPHGEDHPSPAGAGVAIRLTMGGAILDDSHGTQVRYSAAALLDRADHLHVLLRREILQARRDHAGPPHRTGGIDQHNGEGRSGPGDGERLRHPRNRLSHLSLAEAVNGDGKSRSKRGAVLPGSAALPNCWLHATIVLQQHHIGALLHQFNPTYDGPTPCRLGCQEIAFAVVSAGLAQGSL